jgi:1-deoxy-D-xylulose-5-phosphate reductoisomerase
VIHPRSVVHSLVEFVDGTYKAQLGMPDMRLPIAHALSAPERTPSDATTPGPLDWGALEFAPLVPGAYPAYDLARSAGAAGGNRGTILNAADEVAVAAFLGGTLGFAAIPEVIDRALQTYATDSEPELDDIQRLDAEVRSCVSAWTGMSS